VREVHVENLLSGATDGEGEITCSE